MLGCYAEITIFFFFQRSYSGRLWDTLSSSSLQQHQRWLISTGMWAENLLQTLSLRLDHQSSLSEIGFISTHFSIQHLPYFGVRAAKSSEMEQQDASSAAILKKIKLCACWKPTALWFSSVENHHTATGFNEPVMQPKSDLLLGEVAL